MHQVHLLDTDEMLECGGSVSVLQSMERLGRKGIPVGCRNGGCGVCKIRVVDGQFDRRVMSRAHVSLEEEGDGFALACRITPRSNLAIKVVGTMR